MSAAAKILVIGSSNTDMVVRCPELPGPGETVLGGEFIRVQGGKGANQAVAAARMGGRVIFAAKTGDDAFGAASIEAYGAEGIDTRFILREPGCPSGVALILVDRKGENSIAVAPGANARLTPDAADPALDELEPGDVLLMQLEIPIETVEHAARRGREKGARVILDPAPAPKRGLSDILYRNTDFILPNEREAGALTGCESARAMAGRFLERGVRHALVTLGGRGVVHAAGGDCELYPAYSVPVADSTAAGDAFAGALAAMLAAGKDVEEAAALAQKAAAISVTRPGAQPSLPKLDEIARFSFS